MNLDSTWTKLAATRQAIIKSEYEQINKLMAISFLQSLQ